MDSGVVWINQKALPLLSFKFVQLGMLQFLNLRKKKKNVLSTGIGKCPMTWGYWTSPKIVAIKKTIYLMVG